MSMDVTCIAKGESLYFDVCNLKFSMISVVIYVKADCHFHDIKYCVLNPLLI